MKLAQGVSVGSPTLEQSFPTLFSRSQPVIDRKSPLVYAASLLRFHSVEAAMMLMDGAQPMRVGTRVAFVSGYSVLATLMQARPEQSYRVLFEQSERSAVAVQPLRSARDLRELLLVFQDARFGFTAVSRGTMHAMLGLSDVIGLYKEGVLDSDLVVRDVASRVVTVDRHLQVKEAMKYMFDHRIRRIFVSGTNAFVSDREIVSSVFSPRRLGEIKRSPRTLLDGTLLEVGPVEPTEVEGDMPVKEAARLALDSQGGALICDAGVVSPWDLVMKPFAAGRLSSK